MAVAVIDGVMSGNYPLKLVAGTGAILFTGSHVMDRKKNISPIKALARTSTIAVLGMVGMFALYRSTL